MLKILNLKPQDEITSVVEYLWETNAEGVILVAPKNSLLLQNIIGLKLLKREADHLKKEILIISADSLGREYAKRAGLAARAIMPKAVEDELRRRNEQEVDDIKEEEGEETAGENLPEDNVLQEMPSGEFESLIQDQINAKKAVSMSDIRPKVQLVEDIIAESMESEEAEDGESENCEEENLEESESKVYAFEIPPEDLYQRESLEKDKLIELIADINDDDLPRKLEDVEEKEEPREELLKNIFRADEKKQDDFLANRVFSAPRKKFRERDEYSEKKQSLKFTKKIIICFVAVVFIIVCAALYLILPKADVKLSPKSEEMNQILSVIVDKGVAKIDTAAGKIPGQVIQIDKKESKEFLATGQKQLNESARGVITVYNEYSSTPQSLVEKTRFVSENGKVFKAIKGVVVPGAVIQDGKIMPSSIAVEVIADQSGEEYNIGSGRFTIPGFQGTPKYNSFYGRSDSAMAGGAVGLSKVVSQEDYDKAKIEIQQALESSLNEEFKSQSPNGLKVLDEARRKDFAEIVSDIPVGGKAEKFILSVKGSISFLLFDEQDIVELVKQKMGDAISEGKKIANGSEKIEYQQVKADFVKKQIIFKAAVKVNLLSLVDIDDLKQELVGKDENAVKQILSRHSEISEAKVVFWPFFVKSMPSNLDKIKIIIAQ